MIKNILKTITACRTIYAVLAGLYAALAFGLDKSAVTLLIAACYCMLTISAH